MHARNVVMRSNHRARQTFQYQTESSGSDIKTAWLEPDTVRIWNPEILVMEVRVCDEMFTASLIRFETVGKTAESGNRHLIVLTSQRLSRQSRVRTLGHLISPKIFSESADQDSGRYNRADLLTECGRHRSDFLSLVRERIEVRVFKLPKAACKDDSTPHPTLSSIEEEKRPNRPFRRWHLFALQHSSCVPRHRLKRNQRGCPTDSFSSKRQCDRALSRCSRSSSPR